MAVVDKAELIKRFSERFVDDTSDEVIQLTEDLSDTLNDYENRAKDEEDWKAKFEENDAEWRKKYKERFLNSSNSEDTNDNQNSDENDYKNVTFNDLFD
jgi:hypothetical protein